MRPAIDGSGGTVDEMTTYSTAAGVVPPGWYPDPWRLATLRWWDGQQWTGWLSGGVAPSPLWKPAGPKPKQTPQDISENGLCAGRMAVVGAGAALAFSAAASVVVLVGALLSGVHIGTNLSNMPTALLAAVLVASQAGLWGGLVGACIIASRRYGTGHVLSDLRLRKPTRSDVLYGVGMGAGARAVMTVVAFGLDKLTWVSGATNGVPTNRGAGIFILAALLAVVGAPLVEESFFRGLVQPSLIKSRGMWVGLIIASILFAAAHLLSGLTIAAVIFGIFPIGMMLGWMAYDRHSLTPGIVAHATFNLLAVVLVVLVR